MYLSILCLNIRCSPTRKERRVSSQSHVAHNHEHILCRNILNTTLMKSLEWKPTTEDRNKLNVIFIWRKRPRVGVSNSSGTNKKYRHHDEPRSREAHNAISANKHSLQTRLRVLAYSLDAPRSPSVPPASPQHLLLSACPTSTPRLCPEVPTRRD